MGFLGFLGSWGFEIEGFGVWCLGGGFSVWGFGIEGCGVGGPWGRGGEGFILELRVLVLGGRGGGGVQCLGGFGTGGLGVFFVGGGSVFRVFRYGA